MTGSPLGSVAVVFDDVSYAPHGDRVSDPRTDASRPSVLRQAAVLDLVRAALDEVAPASGTVTVLDCGGGTGALAVPLARAGANVTVMDISVDALATLNRRAHEAGVADRVTALQGDLEAPDLELMSGVGAGYDLVIAHDVFESLGSEDALKPAVNFLASVVRPGGAVSLLVANPVSTVLARVLAGEVGAAVQLLRRLASSEVPAVLELASEACLLAGLIVEDVQGVGVFTELIPGGEIDGLPFDSDIVSELESLGSRLSPFRDVAGRVRILARRPLES